MNAQPNDAETEYRTPGTLEEARELLDTHGRGAKIIAGAQSAMLMMRQGLLNPDAYVDINDVPDLQSVTVDEDAVRIGGTTTYNELESHDVADEVHALGDATHVIADRQVRNMGTVGGAVAHADASLDIVPPLLCLDATVHVGSVDGARTIPLSDFLAGYMETALEDNELLEAIEFPLPDAEAGTAYEKHSNVAGGWATVGAGSLVTLSEDGETFENVRLALAAVAETAIRATAVEEALAGQQVEEDAVRGAIRNELEDEIDPLDDISGSRSYKIELTKNLAERSIGSAVERAGGELA